MCKVIRFVWVRVEKWWLSNFAKNDFTGWLCNIFSKRFYVEPAFLLQHSIIWNQWCFNFPSFWQKYNLFLEKSQLKESKATNCTANLIFFSSKKWTLIIDLSCFFPVPPTRIEIEGVKSGSRLSVRENEMVELKCIVHHAKPKATIVWFRENAEFYSGKHTFSLHLTCRCEVSIWTLTDIKVEYCGKRQLFYLLSSDVDPPTTNIQCWEEPFSRFLHFEK